MTASQRRIAGGQDCPDCGETLSVVAKYCKWCGTQLRAVPREDES